MVQHFMLAGYIFEAQHAIVVPYCIVKQGGLRSLLAYISKECM